MRQPGPIIGRATWRRWPPLVRVLVAMSAVAVLVAVGWASTPTTVVPASGGSRLSCAPAILGAWSNPSDSGGLGDAECAEAQWARVRPVVVGAGSFVAVAVATSAVVLVLQRRRPAGQRPHPGTRPPTA